MSSKTESILLGGAITGVAMTLISLVPIVGGCIACFGYLIAGVVVVWHYTNTQGLTITGGEGAGMGALGGIVAAIAGSLVSYVLIMLDLAPGMDAVLDQLTQAGTLTNEQLDAAEGFFDSPLVYLAFFAVGSIVGALLGAIGGAIGASVFKKGGEFPA